MAVPRFRSVGAVAARAARLVAATAIAVVLAAPSLAQADAGADRATATELLTTIAAPGTAEARLAAAAKLRELAPRLVDLLGSTLRRARTSTVDERRAVLHAIGAAVPDASGKFSQPKRQKSAELKADDDVDWLPALLALDPAQVRDGVNADDVPAPLSTTALAEVIQDIAVIRALTAAKDPAAAAPVFDAAFGEDTMIYRDECGRYLRKMEPSSIPVLTTESQGSGDRRRYATYQLERLDRQDPAKALSAATTDEALLIAILDAFRTTKHREAVYAVYEYIDHGSPRVRAAARAAWLAYVTGRPPKPAPKRKMVMPGGKLAKKETPMWLTYRELAEEKLRKVSDELLGEPLPEEQKVNVEQLSKRVFEHFDAIRAKGDAEQWSQTKRQAAAGDLAGAATKLDQLLAINPAPNERVEMAELYLAYGKALQKQDQWSEAASAYSKAFGLVPTGATAKDVQAARDFALGKAMEAEGHDGTGLFRRAADAKPDFEEAAEASTAGERPRWMLYVAALAGLFAVGLAALGVARRRGVA